MNSTPVLALKISLGTDIRRISVATSELSFKLLHSTVGKLFKSIPEDELDAYAVRYQDEEKDWITIASDEELLEAVSSAKAGILRLSLFKTDSPKKSKEIKTEQPKPILAANPLIDIVVPVPESTPEKTEPALTPVPETQAEPVIEHEGEDEPEPQAEPVSPEVDALVTLESMGFADREKNLKAIKKAKGDIAVAVQILLDSQHFIFKWFQ